MQIMHVLSKKLHFSLIKLRHYTLKSEKAKIAISGYISLVSFISELYF